MRSETMDFTIEEYNGALWFHLEGPFTADQIPTFKEKFQTLIDDGNRIFVINLQQITVIDTEVVQLFLHLLNMVKEKRGTFNLVFSNDTVSRVFHPYRNIFSIYPDTTLLRTDGILSVIQKTRRTLLKKTGIRISRQIALLFLLSIFGLIAALLVIISLQSRHIKEQQTELHELLQWETRSRLEIETLRKRLRPLEQLGILRDTTENE
jgi:anti-anti-sigma factor